MLKSLQSIFLILAIALSCGAAYGQEEVPGTYPGTQPLPAPTNEAIQSRGFFEHLDGAASQLIAKLDTVVPEQLAKVGMDIANEGRIKTAAYQIAGMLATMYFFHEVLRTLGKDGRTVVNIIFDVGIPLLIAGLLISEYEPNMKRFKDLLDVFRGIAGGNPAADIMDMYKSILGSISTAISESLSMSSAIKALTGEWTTVILNVLLTVLFSILILAIVVFGIADVFALFLMGPFLFAIGVAFGPLLIAGIVTPWTRDYFTKWVQFIVASAVLTGVVTVIFKLAGALFKSIHLLDHASKTTETTAVSMVTMVIMMLAVNSLISQAPSIASAMVPGSIGAGKPNRELGRAAKGAGEGAKHVAKQAPTPASVIKMVTAALGKK